MKEFTFLIDIFTHLIVPGTAILVVFMGLRLFKRKFDRRREFKSKMDKYLPIAEILIWLVFSSWVIIYFLKDQTGRSIFIFTLITIIMVIFAWIAMKDIFAGIIIRLDNSFKVNEWVKIKDVSGKINKLGYRTFQLETNTGELVSVPYSQMSGEILTKPNLSDKIKSHSFTVHLSDKKSLDETTRLLVFTLANTPWSSLRKLPSVRFIKEHSGRFQFEIIIYSMKSSYFESMKKELNDRFKDLEIGEPLIAKL